MPTIDQLNPVIVSSDDDHLLVSQGGAMRRATRAQLLAGTQAALSLAPGLLGRSSAGVGAPEEITVGSGLSLKSGVLAGATPFTVSGLPVALTASPTDQVAMSQGGQDRSVSIASLLAVSGADISRQLATAQVGGARSIGDWLSDAIAVETFGAFGDGMTDDTAAFRRAVSSGRAVRLAEKVYRVDGQWSISTSTVLLGTPGRSTIRRAFQAGGAWIEMVGASLIAHGVTFDGGGLTSDSWGVLIDATCTHTHFETCTFTGILGPTLGTGLVVQARDGLQGLTSSHTVRDCEFYGNAVHGLWVQAAAGAIVDNCTAHDNGQYGICLDFNDPTFQQVVRQSVVSGCRSWGNTRGISVGNYNQTNLEPPYWGLQNPDALDIVVTNNVCDKNSGYAIAVSGERIRVSNNQINVGASITGASGLLCNASRSVISGNTIAGPGAYGIDAGGCADCEIIANIVDGFDVGINAGGGTSVRVASNRLSGNERGITVFLVETDGTGSNFGLTCSDLTIESNVIELKDSGSGGVIVADGAKDVVITYNAFKPGVSSHPEQAVQAKTDSVTIFGNIWNGSRSIVVTPVANGNGASLVFPDLFDYLVVDELSIPITSITGDFQAALSGSISFVRMLAGGSGYRSATVEIAGSGSGALASAYVRDGQIIGITVVSGGTGYDQSVPQVTITGDGTGASAQAFVGLPIPEGRRLKIACKVPVNFRFGNLPLGLTNWTGTDIGLPASSEVTWVGESGGWRGISFSNVDYLSPSGSGAVVLRSIQGDVTLCPGHGGQVRLSSAEENSGCVSCIGRGPPEGVVIAPPGSDYRNLDGGVGLTLWIKNSGNGSAGWTPVA